MAAIPVIRINPNAGLRREQISANDFCVIVDDFLQDPDMLVELAARHLGDFANPNIGYPGVQLRVNDDAMKDIFRFVRSKMSKAYSFMRGRIGIRSLLSMLTCRPEQLSLLQRICHIDPNPAAAARNMPPCSISSRTSASAARASIDGETRSSSGKP